MLLAACSSAPPTSTITSAPNPTLAAIDARFPLAQLDDRALCDRLLARTAGEFGIYADPDPKIRRKAIVSDLHLGPGDRAIEDFYAEAEWDAFLVEQAAAGPTDVIVAGDFVEFWQIAALDGILPQKDDPAQPETGPVLAGDQPFAVSAIDRVIRAHPTVFRSLGAFLDGGDHRVVIVAGNHDADLLWPKVQRQIARAIAPRDPARLVFVDAAAYEHGGVHVEHGHAHDPANHFATNHAPFGRDRTGSCRLQSNWGEIFVDRFYTETERQVPFIDNLYPESAAILWAMRDNTDLARDIGAAIRFLELVRTAESGQFNREAITSAVDSILGTSERGAGDLGAHILDQLAKGDRDAERIAGAILHLITDPELQTLWAGVITAARALPDARAALSALATIDPASLAKLRALLLGEPFETAAHTLLRARSDLRTVVYGHTHAVGGELKRYDYHTGAKFYANTGSWLSVASVAELKARGADFTKLTLADRATFPTRATAVIVEPNAPPRLR